MMVLYNICYSYVLYVLPYVITLNILPPEAWGVMFGVRLIKEGQLPLDIKTIPDLCQMTQRNALFPHPVHYVSNPPIAEPPVTKWFRRGVPFSWSSANKIENAAKPIMGDCYPGLALCDLALRS